jgi:two-component system NtrC family response regulator
VLIVDDEKTLRDGLSEAVRDLGYAPVVASSGREALAVAAQTNLDAVLLDLRMPDMDGLQVLTRLRNEPRGTKLPVAIITAYATAANTIEAMRLGAFDHLTKPVGRDDLASLLERMLRSRAPRSTELDPVDRDSVPEDLIGSSNSIRQVQKTIGLVADSDATVLITGETGTGKEVVARTIHRVGARSAGPFMALNCAAIPPDLLESELFGHVKGAFTGAVLERKGAFREAHGGREDLFYRLNVVPIELQPLRSRGADVLPLAEHFLALASSPKKQLSEDATQQLVRHAWPGNVRELRNAMERVAVMCRSDIVTASDLGFLTTAVADEAGESGNSADLSAAVENLERRMIAKALAESKGNRAEAARRLGIHRQLLHAKAEKYGLGKRDGGTN